MEHLNLSIQVGAKVSIRHYLPFAQTTYSPVFTRGNESWALPKQLVNISVTDMTQFKDLSVDLIYVIFSHLQSDKAQLRSLALSSRLFRDIAQKFIVRNASISHSINGSRTNLFLRTLRERPDLVAHVHRLELDLLREDIHWPEEQQNIHQITRLLTNLRELCYLSRDYKVWHYSVPQPLKWGREGIHDQVRKIAWHHNMAPWELRQCMELPRIECIYVKELADSNGRSNPFKVPERKYKTSSLADLRLGSPYGITYEALLQLLQLPRSLKRITFDSHMRHSSIMAPADLVSLLKHVKDTLEELVIDVRNAALELPIQTADFSGFGSLKKLTVPFRYLFDMPKDEPYHSEPNLPPSLSELEMVFTLITPPSTNFSTEKLSANMKNLLALLDWLQAVGGHLEPPLQTPKLQRISLHQCDKLSVIPDLRAVDARDLEHNLRSRIVGQPHKRRLELKYYQCTIGEHRQES